MSLKWKKVYSNNSKQAFHTSGQVAAYLVDDAPDYHAGAVESVREQNRKLTELLAAVVDALPDKAQREVLEKVGNYAFEEIK